MSVKIHRIIFIILAVVFLSATPLLVQGVTQVTDNQRSKTEEVTSFSADIVVSLDGTISVTERIDYYFSQPRHGIYRDLPVRYELDDGREVIIPLEVVSVEGGSYELERSRSMIRIRIGDPQQTITGQQSYEIKYIASGALRYFIDHDELYWNVTGNDWSVPLRRVAARVYLPDGAATESLKLACYTGPYGSVANDCLYHRLSDGASFAADDALTVVVGWRPTGLIARLEPLRPTFWSDYIQPYGLPILLGLLLPLFVFIFMYRKWQQQGRDPVGRGTLVVQYDPPADLTPAEVGVLMDERADIRDISATIVDLAVRGYLKIIAQPKKLLASQDYEFVRLKDFIGDSGLRSHEQEILQVMFGGGTSITLKNLISRHKFHAKLSDLKEKLYEQLETKGFFPHNPNRIRQKYRGLGLVLFMIAFCFGVLVFPGWGAGSIFVYLTMLALSIAVSGIIIAGFGLVMPCKTSAGVQAFEHARGFRLYLNQAEKYRLEWQEKENIFEKFLPYAMVFDVADHWTKAFKDMALPPPKWFEGQTFVAGHFEAGRFLSAMVGLESGLMRAVSSSPQKSSRGSGFSGGSSGGGGGGGGGGSW
ncbi:DUF2207 domain-containing protein [Patescibacteria group bacterium]|nr:DUF2207 domain-containing protein [Patescibacteria group bacterium]